MKLRMQWAFGVLALAVSATAALAVDNADIKLRGAGKTRDALNAMQLKAFDHSVWSSLSTWNGDAFKPASADGKVVMIVTWASWYPQSHRAMRAAQTAFTQYNEKGLLVVGVHNPRGFDGAAANAKEMGITFPFAEDKEGKFRAALKGDQDPNVYFIDRAGQMRFAQAETASIMDAAALLVGETAEQAGKINADLDTKRRATEKEKWLTRDPSGLAPGEELTVTFKEPDEDDYKKVKWPYLVGKVEKDAVLERIKNDPPVIKTWPEENWVPAAPKRAGKLLVIYYVDPQMVEMLNVIPTMNRLRDEYGRDIVVVCSMFKRGQQAFTNQGGTEEDAKLIERNQGFVPTMIRARPINHFLIPQTIRYENFELGGGGMLPNDNTTTPESGFATIVSTDLKMRWLGNPYNPDLRIALDKLAAVDPAVVARRKAEKAKIGK